MTNPRLSWLKSLTVRRTANFDASATKSLEIFKGLRAFFISHKQRVLAITFIVIAITAAITLVSFGNDGEEEIVSRRVPITEIEEYAGTDWRRDGGVGGESGETEGASDGNSSENNVSTTPGSSEEEDKNGDTGSNDAPDTYKASIETVEKYAAAKMRQNIDENYTPEEYLALVESHINAQEYNDIFAQSYITPEEGGVLEAGNYKVVFPAGAVSEVVIATIRVNATTKESITEGTLGQRYSLTATNVYGEEITQFGNDLEITVELKSSDTASGNTEDAAIYYLNEETNSWDKLASNVVTEAGDTSVTTNTNHFSEYMAAAEEPTDPEEEEYPYEYCRLAVDDYNESTEDKDRSECFSAGGLWQLHSAGHNDTSLYAPNFVMSEALWIPDFKSLTEEKEIFVTIPGLPQNDDPEQEQYELTENVTYLVLHAEGVEEVLIDQSEEFGNGLVSLGTYDFAGEEAAVFIYNSSPNYVEPTYFMADLVCFGEEA